MDDLLLFPPSKSSHIAKLEDLLKALFMNDLKISQRNVSYLGEDCNTWVMRYLLRTKEFALNH